MLSASASYSTKPKVFIVLPAFNEAENLKLLLPDLRATLLQLHAALLCLALHLFY